MRPLPIQILSFSGSAFGQNRFAIASLMTTTGGAAPSSRSVKARPRSTGILNTSKYPGETVSQPPPPWNGPSVSGRPMTMNGRP